MTILDKLNEYPIKGKGNTAIVYQINKKKVIKVFNEGYSMSGVKREYNNSLIINEMPFLKPKALEFIDDGVQIGIIYEAIEGETLLENLFRTNDLKKCATELAKLHKQIISQVTDDAPDYKTFLRNQIINQETEISAEKKVILKKLDKLPTGNNLCHGDFHPGNIIVNKQGLYVIDFMNIVKGDYLYDIARTLYLIQYSKVPGVQTSEELLIIKKTMADLYLKEMNVNREQIKDYLEIIKEARKIECPYEFI